MTGLGEAYWNGRKVTILSYVDEIQSDRTISKADLLNNKKKGHKPIGNEKCPYCGCRLHDTCSLTEHYKASFDCDKQRKRSGL